MEEKKINKEVECKLGRSYRKRKIVNFRDPCTPVSGCTWSIFYRL
jgi:hypothetical protein